MARPKPKPPPPHRARAQVMHAFTSASRPEAMRLARAPHRLVPHLQLQLDQCVCRLSAAKESDSASKTLLSRATRWLNSFMELGVQQVARDDDCGDGLDARIRSSFKAEQAARACREERLRCLELQRAADARLLAYHDETIAASCPMMSYEEARVASQCGMVIDASHSDMVRVVVDVVRVEAALDKAAINKRTLPQLLKRTLNTKLPPHSPSERRPVLVVSTSGSVLMVWLRGALGDGHDAARAECRRHHFVSGGWAKGCAAEPVASPERITAMWNSLVRLRAYGLNEFSTFVRLEPAGTGYKLGASPPLPPTPSPLPSSSIHPPVPSPQLPDPQPHDDSAPLPFPCRAQSTGIGTARSRRSRSAPG